MTDFARFGRAALLEKPRRASEGTVITDYNVLRDVQTIAGQEAQNWKAIDRNIRAAGDPTALIGFAGVEASPPATSLTAVTGVAVETALWPAATWTPITAGYQAPKSYSLVASGQVTTAAASTLILTPRIGTTTGGSTLGACGAQTLGTTITNATWRLHIDLTLRTAGSGTSSTAVAVSLFSFTLTAGSAAPTNVLWGHTVATYDSTVSQGLFIGATPSVSTVSLTPFQVRWVSFN